MGKKQSAINQLSLEQKRKLLAKLEQKKKQKKQLFPLSFAQARLWFLDRLQPGTAAYNIPVALELKGKLNLLTLKNSLNEIVQRHEILRTIFIGFDDEPKQKIIQSLTLDIPLIDLQELSKEHQEIEIQTNIKTEALRSFNLEKSPLLRSIIFQRDQEDYVLIFTVHHIIADYWSMRVLIQELAAIYEAFSQQKPSPLPSLPIQYADFAVWQRKWLQGEARVKQLEYWREKLRNNPPILQLPTDFPRPPIQTFQGTTEEFFLSLELSNTLKKVSRQAGTTLFMTLLAAFKVLLYRYTGQDDILVGSTVANRNRTEIENLIGLFVNNLVFRTEITSNISFWDFLTQVKEVALGAYAHQDLPFEYLVEVLQPERNLSHNPLFQVMFILHNTPSEKVRLPGLSLNTLSWENQTSRFDLSLDMYETSSGLRGVFEYNTGLFKGTTIKRLIKHFKTLLQEIVNAPEEKISQLNLLTSSEQKELFIQGRREQGAGSREIYIHQLFETQVKKSPNKIAVIFNNESLTYQQLNQKANQLAHYLQRLGVKPETLVGICLDPSLDMVISLLAILKAGGAYLPLDPNYPEQRLDFMIKDSGIDYLIKGSEGDFVLLRSGVRNSESVKYLIDINKVQGEINQEKKTNLDVDINLDNLAYIIYTSGSTGIPKGVQIPHRALSNFLVSMSEKPGLTDDDTLLSVTTLSFDIAALELYLPLIVGAKLVLVPRTVAQDGVTLGQQLESHQVTVMQGTPATWKLLLASGWEGKKDLTIFCGGEALDPSLGQHLQQKSRAVWNLYGPTETTIWSSVYQVTSDKVRLGKPINNTQFYVLDKDYNQVPIGVPGELYIGGMGVARGYLNRPKLTAERFMAIPSTPLERGGKAGSRLYKTGDLVKYGEDGEIEYLGRTDYQLKLRGFRLELGEIETILLTHPQVKEAVVIVKEESLIAYIVSTHTPPLKDFLAEKLPSYMIPSRFIELDSLPLTPNGKIDRNALPEIELNHKDYIAPKTATEEILAGIWANILNLNQVSVEDNFFELGGHSLLATRVMSQVRQVFERELPLRVLFEKPTIRSLSNAIDGEGKQEILSFQKIDRHGELPLSFAQQRQWFLSQLEPNSPFYNIAIALRLHGCFNIVALTRSFQKVIDRHEVLRTRFLTQEGKPYLTIAETTDLSIPLIDLSLIPLEKQEKIVTQLTQKEAQQPFNLEYCPLLRVKLLRLAEQEHILLLTMHHIVSDGWSMGILVQEIATLYRAFCEEQPSPLEALPFQYVEFAAWQRKWLQGEILDTQLAYWQQQLKDAPTLLELPCDYPRPPVQNFHGSTSSFTLSQPLAQHLQRLCHQAGTTLFMLLLSAFSVLLHRYSNSEDIIIGSPIANRNYREIEGLIGFFVNTLALRINLSGNPTFLDLLQQVRQVALGAYSHQDLPFERLLEALEVPRSLSHTPLFQVMFVLENTPLDPIELPGLQWEPLEMDNHTAKFDLTLTMRETEEGLRGRWEYNTDLFEQETIIRLGKCFETLLDSIVADAEQPISELSLLNEAERQLSLGRVESGGSVEGSIHELFEVQVKNNPNAIALIYETQQLTYQELDIKANQLAHYLQRFGVKPDTLIGLCVERSLSMIIAILAILKAGGAYVPIDPNAPSERIDFLLEDTQINLLLTQRNIDHQWPNTVTVIDLDEKAIAQESPTLPVTDTTSEHLAYVMYTSGSTGIPKGVCIPHRGVIRLVKNSNYVDIREDDVFLQAAPYTFDASTFEIWGALLNGGRLVILPSPTPSLEELGEAIENYGVTTLWLTAGLFHLMVEEKLESFKNVRYLLAGGDVLFPDHVKTVLRTYPHCCVINGYGPTENTTFTCCAVLTDVEQIGHSVPIGRPISQTQVYILDPYLHPVPFGVPGELYIGGGGLARGYLNRPELTAERFIPIPPTPITKGGGKQGERLYKTGDLGRYDRKGNIEFLGRKDNQVKIRGFRIELGEIEAILSQYPKVQSAIAVVKATPQGNKQLIAYVVPKMGEILIIQELKTFLTQKLPDYLHPNHYMILEAFPLTPNGKVDRRSLPQPILSTSTTEAPRNAIETQLVKIWQDVLNLEKVGIEDNFFGLGGDSILAIQIVSRASRQGLKLSPKQLFQHQTIAQLAAVVTSIDSSVGEQGLVTGSLPLNPIQHWFFGQNLAEMAHFNQSAFLEVSQTLNIAQLQTVFAHLIRHHDALRLRFNPTETGWEAMIRDAEDQVPLTHIDLSGLSDEVQEKAIAATANQLQGSLNLSSGPLLRIAVFDLGNSRSNQLLIIIHHLAVDGVSWRILLEDLQTAYQQLAQNQPIELPLKTTSVKTWAKQVQTYLIEGEKDYYWQQVVSKTPVALPVDYPGGKNTVATTEQITVTLDEENTQTLLKTVPKAYDTQINEVLLTALVETLVQWTGQRSLLINLESHGREDIWENINLSRTVGWFTSLFPVFLDVEGSDSLLDALKAVKGQLGSIPHQGIGYGVMRYLYNHQEIQSLAEISFNYLGQFDALLSDNSQFCLSPYDAGLHHHPNQPRPHLLEINGLVMRGQLQFTWSYSNQLHKSSTIEAIAQGFINILERLINDCQDEPLSDISLTDLDQDTLKQVLGMVDFEG